MQNSYGNNVIVTLFGESHGPLIGAVIDGLPAGFQIDLDQLKADMDKRRAKNRLATPRREKDEVELVSGFFNGYTTGAPLTILIRNENTRSGDYEKLKHHPRPSHADYTAQIKYKGYQDYRGGGHFSGRLTAPLVAAGSICHQILRSLGISIQSHIYKLYDLYDAPFSSNGALLNGQLISLSQSEFPAIDVQAGQIMQELIEETAKAKDSLGGIVETAIVGIPAGLGEPFFDSVESVLAHLLFSIPALKALSFGDIDFSQIYGSKANDCFELAMEEGVKKVKTKTNHNGGLNGGITNGMPILLRSTFKPTASISKPQMTLNLETEKEEELVVGGRHDPAIIYRAVPVVSALCAIGILDLYMQQQAREIL